MRVLVLVLIQMTFRCLVEKMEGINKIRNQPVIKIKDLPTNQQFLVEFLEKINTKYGPSLKVTLTNEADSSNFVIFLPKEYTLLNEGDIDAINTKAVKCSFVFYGVGEGGKQLYALNIHQPQLVDNLASSSSVELPKPPTKKQMKNSSKNAFQPTGM